MIIRYSELIGKNAEIFFREIPNLGKPVISLFSAYGCFQSMLLRRQCCIFAIFPMHVSSKHLFIRIIPKILVKRFLCIYKLSWE